MSSADRRVARAEQQAWKATPQSVIDGAATELRLPRTGDFVVDPHYLGLSSIYPRQLTFLKLVFLEIDHLTSFDRTVIEEWTSDFRIVETAPGDRLFQGTYGTPPDVWWRAERCLEEGRPWFHDVIAPMGRRAGKGFLMSVSCCRILWWLFCQPNGPHEFLHLPPTKRLNISVFAGKKDQAEENQWRDIVDMLLNAPCFQRYIAKPPGSGDTLLLYTPPQLAASKRPEPDRALIEIVARETTRNAGRGPASLALFFDEMSYMMATGLNRSADEVFGAAAPANKQFGNIGFIGQTSSPWQRTDRFYENYQRALRVDSAGRALHHESLVMQLPTWDMYKDWEMTK